MGSNAPAIALHAIFLRKSALTQPLIQYLSWHRNQERIFWEGGIKVTTSNVLAGFTSSGTFLFKKGRVNTYIHLLFNAELEH